MADNSKQTGDGSKGGHSDRRRELKEAQRDIPSTKPSEPVNQVPKPPPRPKTKQ